MVFILFPKYFPKSKAALKRLSDDFIMPENCLLVYLCEVGGWVEGLIDCFFLLSTGSSCFFLLGSDLDFQSAKTSL